MVRSSISFAAPVAVLALLLGCQDPRQLEIDRLQKELRELGDVRAESKRLAEQLARQEEQVRSLMALGEKRLERLYHVTSIKLGDHTGGIDTDGQDGHDAVKAFVLPMDQYGSIVKAAGEVKVQLFDLAAGPEKNLVGECSYGVDEVAGKWYGGFLAYHYSFVCPWSEGARPHEEVTIRVEFTDYLTGRKFTAQKAVKVKPPPGPAPRPPATLPSATIPPATMPSATAPTAPATTASAR